MVGEMDFSFLLNRGRMLFSVAFEMDKQANHPACYDLLASEARIAYFVAIAKDDIPQDCWFQLTRPLIQYGGLVGLISWTGTMFEYLMPPLWMRSYANTLLEHATQVAVHCQRDYAASKGVPWGISESSSGKKDGNGNYHYFAFGVPQLAIFKPEQDGPVISPYSTLLALDVDPEAALKNVRSMQRKGWLGAYGFYEALDFTPPGGTARFAARRWSAAGWLIMRVWACSRSLIFLMKRSCKNGFTAIRECRQQNYCCRKNRRHGRIRSHRGLK